MSRGVEQAAVALADRDLEQELKGSELVVYAAARISHAEWWLGPMSVPFHFVSIRGYNVLFEVL